MENLPPDICRPGQLDCWYFSDLE